MDSAKIENVFRLEQLLPHRRNQVGAASEDLKIRTVPAEVAECFLE
jgi:hypothetical protein